MNVSQVLNHINENNYDDDITITDIPKGHFPAVTSITLPQGSNTREIRVDILPMEQIDGGTMNVNSGLFVRGADETAVKATVYQDGKELASNTQSYS